MKKLIVCRHGNYGDDKRLDASGREQMRQLASQLRLHLSGCAVRVLSSTAPRAVDSAETLIRALALDGLSDFELHPVLWSDEERRENLSAALELVRTKFEGIDVLVLVTHFEYAEGFPSFFARRVLDADIRHRNVAKGGARVIDCIDKKEVALS